MDTDFDVVVVGGGAAGLSAALTAATQGRRVALLVKTRLGDGATRWAQGGLAAVVSPEDSLEDHVSDTISAGAGLCVPAAVGTVVRGAPDAVARLQAMGARFDHSAGKLLLGLEGGHRRHRIVHAGGDASGAEVSRTLVVAVRASAVTVLEHSTVVDVLLDERGQAVGLELLDSADQRRHLGARAVVLATGGLGQVYATTTNPPEATGDGLALALRAGATLRDVEFVQFHPTALHRPGATGSQQPLITEALRGAGAVLVDGSGHRLMPGVHPLADLAPRDVVAATIAQAMATTGADCVYLDATSVDGGRFEREFPTVLTACRRSGLDPETDPIPVAPAAHYHCGGVQTDLSGRTDVVGLYAVGEVSCTGVHGANRLASNSLTEALVVGHAAGRLLARQLPPAGGTGVAPSSHRPAVSPDARAAIGSAMSRAAGVSRHAEGLARLLSDLAGVPAAPRAPRNRAEVEATNLRLVAQAIATAAMARDESRGCHRRADAPGTSAFPGGFPGAGPGQSLLVSWDGGELRTSAYHLGRTA